MAELDENLKDEVERLREQVAKYNAWFRAIDEHAKFDFWFKDSDSNYNYANPHFAKNMGRDKRQLEETPITELFKGDRFERIRALDQQVMSDEYLNRVIPCDASGKLEMHEEHRFVVKDDNGEPIGLGCFAFEVTEKSLAEKTLDQAEKLAKLCSWRWSAETNALVSCSEQMAEFLGVSITEAFAFFPKRFEEFVVPEDRHVFKTIQDRIDGTSTESYDIEYRMRRQDGELVYVREKAEPFSESNNAAEYLGVLQDVTQQKMTELALKSANENLESKVLARTRELEAAKNIAEKSSEAKSLFLASMSHELRTPLNAIIGFSDLMSQQTLGPFENEGYLELSQHILDSGDQLLRMVEDVLDVASTNDENHKDVGSETVLLTPLIQSTLKVVEDDCKAKSISVIWSKPEQSYALNGRKDKLARAFGAILSNAIRFNKEGGFVKVTVNPTPESASVNGVFIDIVDSGIGISEHDLKQVMLPFVQADNSLTRNFDGAGIGLTVAKNGVELHGGKISIASKLNKGTVVRIFLPTSIHAQTELAPSIEDNATYDLALISA